MNYIKVILFLSIGLTLTTQTEHDEHMNKRQKCVPGSRECLPDVAFNAYPMLYRITLLTVNIPRNPSENPSHWGNVAIDVCILDETETLHLNVKDLQITEVDIICLSLYTDRCNNARTVKYNYSVKESLQLLKIQFPDKLSPGNYSLGISFASNSTDNFFQSQDYGTVQFRPLIITKSARQFFPCWDDPAFKAVFFLQNLRTNTFLYQPLSNANYTLSNKFTMKVNPLENEYSTVSVFEMSPMMTTDQFVLVFYPDDTVFYPKSFKPRIINWDNSENRKDMEDIARYTLFASDIIRNVTLNLANYTNIHPISKSDHLIIRDVPYSTAHLGVIIHRRSDVVYDREKDPITVKFQVAHKITSKVARQWFDGLVTPVFKDLDSTSHSWLNGSFVLFFESYLLNQHKWCEKWSELLLIVVDILHDSMRKDNDSMPAVLFTRNNDYLMTSTDDTTFAYRKGAVLLRMLQHIMGEETFRDGVRKFLHRNQYKWVYTNNLWSAMQSALQNATSKLKFDIKTVMDTWVTQKSFPVVNVTRDYETGNAIISQQSYIRFHDRLDTPNKKTNSIHRHKWWIPLTWTTESNPNFNETTPTLWLEPKNKTINITTNPDEWIIFNLQQTGYYRVHYDRTNWEKIGNYLIQNHTNIHVLNRAQLIDDICDMFTRGHTDWELFSLVTSYLSKETNYIPWVPMLACLNTLSVYFKLPESKTFQTQLANYFDGILNVMGYKEVVPEENDLTRRARRDLALYACTLGNPRCRDAAGSILTYYLYPPLLIEELLNLIPPYYAKRVMPWWEDWTYCFGLKTTNVSIWNKVFEIYKYPWQIKGANEEIILNSLPCTEDPDIIMTFLRKIVEDNSLRENGPKWHLTDTINNVIKMHIHNTQIFSYIRDNYQSIWSVYRYNLFHYIIQNLCCEEQLNEMSKFLRNSDEPYDQYENKIEERRQEIRDLKRKFNSIFGNNIMN